MFSVGRAVRSPRSQRSSAPNNHRNSESEIYRTVAKHHVSEGNTRRLLEKENLVFCVRCISKKLSLSCGKAKTMRPHSERSLRVRRHIASPRKRSVFPERYLTSQWIDFVSTATILFGGTSSPSPAL